MDGRKYKMVIRAIFSLLFFLNIACYADSVLVVDFKTKQNDLHVFVNGKEMGYDLLWEYLKQYQDRFGSQSEIIVDFSGGISAQKIVTIFERFKILNLENTKFLISLSQSNQKYELSVKQYNYNQRQ